MNKSRLFLKNILVVILLVSGNVFAQEGNLSTQPFLQASETQVTTSSFNQASETIENKVEDVKELKDDIKEEVVNQSTNITEASPFGITGVSEALNKESQKTEKKYKKYEAKWLKFQNKSDELYERGMNGLAVGRSKIKLFFDKRRSSSNLFYAADLFHLAKYLNANGEQLKATEKLDSGMVVFDKNATIDDRFYQKTIVSLARSANELGAAGIGYKYLQMANDTIIPSVDSLVKDRAIDELLEIMKHAKPVGEAYQDSASLAKIRDEHFEKVAKMKVDRDKEKESTNETEVTEIKVKTLQGFGPDSIGYFELINEMVYAQVQMGYYRQANELLKRSLRHQVRITEHKKKYTDAEGKKQKEKIKKKEYKRRTYQLAKLHLAEADLNRLMGNYPKSERLYSENKKIIKHLVGKKTPVFFKNYLGHAELYIEVEEFKKAGKLYEKTRKKIKKTNKVSSYGRLYLRFLEGYTKNFINLRNYNGFEENAKKYKELARERFSKKSPQYLSALRLEASGLVYDSPKKASRYLKRVYKRIDKYYSENHIERVPFNQTLYDLNVKKHAYADAKENKLTNVHILKVNLGEEAPRYHLEKLREAEFDVKYSNDFGVADEIFKASFDKAVTTQLHPYHKDYFKFLQLYAQLNVFTDKYKEAEEKLITTAAIIAEKFSTESKYYGIVLEKLAGVYIKQSNFEKAENLLEESVQIIRKEAGKKSIAYVNTLRTLGELYSINGKYNDAALLLKRAAKLSKKLGKFEQVAEMGSTEEMAKVYINTGRYDEAEQLLLKTVELREAKYGLVHYQLISPYNLLGQLYLVKGDFVKAQKVTSSAIDISLETSSDSSAVYFENLALLAKVYTTMGDYDEAEKINENLVKDKKKLFGPTHISVADALYNLALVKLYKHVDDDEIFALLDEAKKITVINLGKEHDKYAEIVQYEAIILMHKKEWDQAAALLYEARLIWENKFGKEHIKTADNIALEGQFYFKKGDFDSSVKSYEKALKLYEDIFSDEHPKYVQSQGKLAQSLYAKKDYIAAEKILDETTEKYLTYIDKYFPALSDAEKSKYWNTIKSDFDLYNSLAINMMAENPKVLGKMYDHKISTKAILLNSSIKVKQRIMNSGDEVLIEKFQQWIALKELLTKAVSMDKEELAAAEINISQLEKDINSIEKELSESSEEFKGSSKVKRYSWNDIRKTLKEKEYAMEIIRFRYFDTQFTDSVIYAALIIDKKSKKGPNLVLLNNGAELEGKYYSYYQNVIKLKAKKDKYSYKMYWQAIDDQIKDGAKVYMSVDGVYNQLNVETFQLADGRFVIDKNDFVNIGNSKDIVIASEEEQGENEYVSSTAILFGNPDFSISTDGMDGMANSVTSIEELPGAEEEVKQVSAYLQEQNWNTTAYIGKQASEEMVKKMESPRVFHVATHGFFYEEPQEELEDENIALSENPLLKSGLLFTGSTSLLAENSIYNFNKREGILTAYEAMNLNLDNTELVVLSACETGKGEVKGGEGVYGLQRSFLVAGAENVIMTLFKVNDEVTQKLMNEFYKNWIETGDKRKAFADAKRTIKASYDEPKYWGSFVLIGMD